MNKLKYWDWPAKYRPQKIKDCVLPLNLNYLFQSFVDEKNIPNMTLVGPAGVGKTSTAMAMLDEIGADWIKINASLKRGMDIVRNDILDFVSTVSLNGERKYVILDEADGILKMAQDGLKALMEEFSDNAGFILTCNSKEGIIEPILSRCPPIFFNFDKDSFNRCASEFLSSVENILHKENIEYDKKVVGLLIKRYYPDFRRILGELQKYSIKEKIIDTGVLGISKIENLDALIKMLKSKEWNNMSKWVGENYNSYSGFMPLAKKLYESIKDQLQGSSIPAFVILMNTYDYQNYFVTDKEINMVAFLTDVMKDMAWK